MDDASMEISLATPLTVLGGHNALLPGMNRVRNQEGNSFKRTRSHFLHRDLRVIAVQ
jgi:hypothetical protein